jgi:hypothetical protein
MPNQRRKYKCGERRRGRRERSKSNSIGS